MQRCYFLETIELWEQTKADNRTIKEQHPEDVFA